MPSSAGSDTDIAGILLPTSLEPALSCASIVVATFATLDDGEDRVSSERNRWGVPCDGFSDILLAAEVWIGREIALGLSDKRNGVDSIAATS